MKRLILALVALFVFSGTAWALTESGAWRPSPGASTGSCGQITGTNVCHWDFTGTEHSPTIQVKSTAARVCLNSNIAADLTGNAQVYVREVHHGTSSEEDHSSRLLNPDGTVATLTATSNCIRVPSGRYFVENFVGASGQTARVTIAGESW